MRVLQQIEVSLEFALGDQDRAEALDRHVGEREEPVEGDAVALAEHALVVGLERFLRRRQRRPLRIVDEVEHEPRLVATIAERVEPLAGRGSRRRTRPCRAGGRHCPRGSRASRRRSRPAAGEKGGQVLLARHLQDGQVAAVDHPHAHVARRADQSPEMRIELGRAAGDVEGRDAPPREEGEHHVDRLARHFLGCGSGRH